MIDVLLKKSGPENSVDSIFRGLDRAWEGMFG